MTTVRVTDATTRAELAESLGFLCQYAKRQQYIVEQFTEDPPTAWTKAHQQINALLTDMERAPA